MQFWTAIEDKLPIVGGIFIVTDGNLKRVCRYSAGRQKFIQTTSHYPLENERFKVTHWCSLQDIMDAFALPSVFIEEKRKKNKDKLLNYYLYDLNELSVRTTNCLINSQIRTIGELLNAPDEKIRSIKNLGKKAHREISELCDKYRKTYGL